MKLKASLETFKKAIFAAQKKSILCSILFFCAFSNLVKAQSIPAYVPSNGLVGWWPFNGNANDESGNGNNGTVNGATLTSDRFNSNNAAYYFNGIDNKIVIQNTLLSNTFSSHTTSVWIKTSSQTDQCIYTDRGPGSYWYKNSATIQNQWNGGWNHASHNNNCVNNALDQQQPVWDGVWHNLVSVFDAQTLSIKLYRDGVLQATQFNITATCYGNIAQPTTIGCKTGWFDPDVSFFNGCIDDIGIWNRALTQQEITNLYNGNMCIQTITVTDTLLINMGITGFNPVTYNNTIKIFPNPTNDHITINYGNFASMNGYQLKIENSLGQQVFQTNITQQSDFVSLANWGGNGLYFVRIIDPQGNTIDIRKIVLQ